MTREEAARVLETEHYLLCSNDSERKLQAALLIAIAALRPQLDENGLARCGCGGRAEYRRCVENPDTWEIPTDTACCVRCRECGLRTAVCDDQQNAQRAWNRSMGVKA